MSSKISHERFLKVENVDQLPHAEAISDKPGKSFDKLLKDHKLTESEYKTVKESVERIPTLTELGVFSAMWSEHCSYKSSRVHLKRFPTKGPSVIVGPGENAGVVRLHNKLCLAFKMESHNHPSYIEPYQGAATGVGGILRDVFCMGSRPIANLNCLRFGKKSHPRTSYLLERVVKGIGDYGNCIGVPTVGGNIAFDETYDGNCLVNAMTVGTIHEDKIFKGYASGTGNLVVYLGSATGRDGIHGATMASDSFTGGENQEKSTVQVGDPFTEKLLLEATLEVLEKGLVVGIQDMGAAGLTSSSFEMAGRAGNGIYFNLDNVPLRAKAMTAYEILLSESQERMLMVIKPEHWDDLAKVLEKWQLAYGIIGRVTDTGRVQIVYQGRLEVDVPVAPLTDKAPVYKRPIKPRNVKYSSSAKSEADLLKKLLKQDISECFLAMLKDTAEKPWIYDQYDHHIGTKTVLGPEAQGGAVLWIRSDLTKDKPYLGACIATSCHERYCYLNPRLGASHAVLKSARMIAASGGEPLAITDCLNYGNPEKPEVMWEFSEGVDGVSEACEKLSIPVVSGNVSLYNETDGKSIYPTPMIGMVGKMDDVRKTVPAVFMETAKVFVLHPKKAKPSLAGSLIEKIATKKLTEIDLPEIDWNGEIEAMNFIRSSINEGMISAVRDVGSGGIATSIAKMCAFKGFELSCLLKEMSSEDQRFMWLFGETHGAYVIGVKPAEVSSFMRALNNLKHCSFLELGDIIDENPIQLSFGKWSFELKDIQRVLDPAVNWGM